MKISSLALAAGVALAAPAFAQTTGTSDTWRMPHERGFWGHAGVSFGQSKLDISCPTGFACDDKDQFLKGYIGGRFNNTFGLEVGAMNFGKFQYGGGETDGWGADAALIAGVPIGANSAVFAKAGVIYARTEVSGTAPGLTTGGMRLQALPLSLSLLRTYEGPGSRRRIAYERLLLDVIKGNSTLFVRRDEVEEAWRWVDGVASSWREAGLTPKPYAAGSWGPAGSFALIERAGRAWYD